MPCRLLRFASVMLCLVVAPGLAIAQVSDREVVTPLPLILDGLPPIVRTRLQLAADRARSRPQDASDVGRLGMLLHAYEQHRSAETCYRIAQQLAPGTMSWTYLLAVTQAELGAHTAAALTFRQSLRIDPSYLPARVRLGDALMNGGEPDASRAEYQALLRDFPALAAAHYGMGRLLWNQGQRAEATEHYERAVALEPRFGRAHYTLALAYRDTGEVDRAQAHLRAFHEAGARRAVVADPLLTEIESLKDTGRDLLAEGVRLDAAGHLTDAITLHLRAIDADPSDAQAHVNLISIYGRARQPEKASEHYFAAVALGTSLPEAHYNYGVLLAGAGRHDAATETFRKALEVDPFHPGAHYNLATLLVRRGELARAADHYRKTLVNDPRHSRARFGLARVLVALNQPLDAVDELRTLLLTEGGDTPASRYALATAYQAAGDLTQAAAHGRRALHGARDQGQTELAAAISRWLPGLTEARR